MYPFIKRFQDKLFVKLNKELYKRDAIERIKNQEPDSIISIRLKKNYYFLELKVDEFEDYFDFLNYLIYFLRIK